MLNIAGIKAAFVIYSSGGDTCISARSLGEINVQLIMEKLGGGGHMTVAGAQIKGVGLEDVLKLLKNSIDIYLEENKKG